MEKLCKTIQLRIYFSYKSKLPCGINDERTPDSKISIDIKTNDNNLMNAYLEKTDYW